MREAAQSWADAAVQMVIVQIQRHEVAAAGVAQGPVVVDALAWVCPHRCAHGYSHTRIATDLVQERV